MCWSLNTISIINVEDLTKVFDGKIKAVDGVSFKVNEGEILGFLGPNGAGKTTTLNMLSTLLRPTEGKATVNGYDILREPDAVRHSIGFVFQDQTLDIELTGRENLDFHGRLYNLKGDVRKQRIRELLEVVQLIDRADDLVKTYSGGMKRRLEIARGLLHYPKVLFLDEPTLGLDPQTRRSIWEHIQRLNQEKNITIILTTHYTEEADYLCSRILIIDFGKIVALDTPEKLKARLKGDVVSLLFKNAAAITQIKQSLQKKEWIKHIKVVASERNNASVNSMMEMMRGMSVSGEMGGMMPQMGTSPKKRDTMPKKLPNKHEKEIAMEHAGNFDRDSRRLNLLVDDGGHRIPEIVKLADEVGVALESVELHKPTLDDVFLSVTGRHIREEQGSFMDMMRRHRILSQARGRRTGH
jgi:ABC-2 type transport system ATP-binding protein